MVDNDCAHYFNETDLSIRTSLPRMAITNKYQMIDELSIMNAENTALHKMTRSHPVIGSSMNNTVKLVHPGPFKIINIYESVH